MRKILIYGTIFITALLIFLTGGLIYFRGGVRNLGWSDYIGIVSILILAILWYNFFFKMLYYQKKIIENYRTTYKKFKELHKIRYRMYFSSIENEKIEQISQLLNKYAMTLLILGTEIRQDEDFPQSYRIEANEIIMDTVKLTKQIQS